MEHTLEFMTPEVLLVAALLRHHIHRDLLQLWDQEAMLEEWISISIPFWVLLKVLVTIVVP